MQAIRRTQERGALMYYIAENDVTLERYRVLANSAIEAYELVKNRLYIGYKWTIKREWKHAK